MANMLTDSAVKALPAPASGNRITYDDGDKCVRGFGVRVTAAGSRSFILNYRTRTGRERRITIGQYPDWKTAAAREEAKALKRRIDRGDDPLADIEADRDAKTVADLTKRFLEEHSERKNRETTTALYTGMINNWILPKLKHLKVAEVTFSDVDGLHATVTKEGGPYAANRMLAALSKMFNLAIKWQWRADNPARGVDRNQEVKRQRYLTGGEITALLTALNEHEDKQAANIVRMLLLTGARRGEVLNATWDQFDLEAGIWTKPGATTKQKTEHRVPLSAPARQLLSEILGHEKAKAAKTRKELAPWVFPGRVNGGPREGIKGPWSEICEAAGFKSPVRIHDLRHTYASILASSGLSLHIIGQLLGHTQAATTHRYSHLFDDPLRAATERVGSIVEAGKRPAAEVVSLRDK
ncbi:tyrosine-type recombinase/integrase [Bradyrhizobium sp. USDA 4473]